MAASEGVDLEWAIAEMIQIKNNKIKKFSRPFSAGIMDQAKKCVDHIYKFAGAKKVEAWHSDDDTNPVGRAISAKPEPKTDLVLKIGT